MLFVQYNSGSLVKNENIYLQAILQVKGILPDKQQLKYLEYITVDGEELYYIKERFGTYNGPGLGWNMSIPWNYKSDTQTFYGDLARTILANL